MGGARGKRYKVKPHCQTYPAIAAASGGGALRVQLSGRDRALQLPSREAGAGGRTRADASHSNIYIFPAWAAPYRAGGSLQRSRKPESGRALCFVSLQGDLLRHPERRCSPAFCNIEGKQVRSAGNYPLFSSGRACGGARGPGPAAVPRCPPRRRARSGAPGRGGAAGPGHGRGPAYKARRRPPLGAASLSPLSSCRRERALPASAPLNGGDGGVGGAGAPASPVVNTILKQWQKRSK